MATKPFQNVLEAPVALQRLFLTDLLSWMAIIAQHKFFTSYVALVIFGGKPDAPGGSPEGELYDQGVRMGSLGLFLHSLVGECSSA